MHFKFPCSVMDIWQIQWKKNNYEFNLEQIKENSYFKNIAMEKIRVTEFKGLHFGQTSINLYAFSGNK